MSEVRKVGAANDVSEQMARRQKMSEELAKLRSGRGQNAGAHFPEEIWVKILEKLCESTDVYAGSQVCTSFQRILRPARTVDLFPEVLQLTEKYLHMSSILNLRLVGRSWRQAVDRLGESSPNLVCYRNAFVKFKNLVGLENFMASMDGYSGSYNPFFTRRVDFEGPVQQGWELEVPEFENPRIRPPEHGEGDQDDFVQFWRMATEVCLKFGAHIWRCSLNVCVAEYSLAYICDVVTSLLELMPALQFFTLTTTGEVPLHPDYLLEEINDLNSFLYGKTVPKLMHLKCLTLPHLPRSWMSHLLEAGSKTVIDLRIDVDPFANTDDDDFSGIEKMENLKRLCIDWETISVCLLCSLQHSNLENQLTIFEAKIFCRSTEELLEVVGELNFFRSLTQLSLTIEFDAVYGMIVYENGDQSKPSLNLEKLECLKISLEYRHYSYTGQKRKTGFDFMGSLPSLEKFLFDVSNNGGINFAQNERERIKISGYVQRMEESNIWELFPNLQVIELFDYDRPEVKHWIYTRKQLHENCRDVVGEKLNSL